jgi:hypothetical protein
VKLFAARSCASLLAFLKRNAFFPLHLNTFCYNNIRFHSATALNNTLNILVLPKVPAGMANETEKEALDSNPMAKQLAMGFFVHSLKKISKLQQKYVWPKKVLYKSMRLEYNYIVSNATTGALHKYIMTKLEELHVDLAIHEASLEKCRDAAHAAKMLKCYNIRVDCLIGSYTKIIKSIKSEIAQLQGKRKPKVAQQ